jgi:hypothetical protein
MKLLLDTQCHGGGGPGPMVPSPTPPWANPLVSPLVQTCFGNDTIVLGVDTTYLMQATAPVAPLTQYVVALPNGTYQRQYHTIIIPGNIAQTTQTFKVTGAFNGFTSLLFNSVAVAAQLVWDGSTWVLLGGSAQESNS